MRTVEGTALDLARFTSGSLRRALEARGDFRDTPVAVASVDVLQRALRDHPDNEGSIPGRSLAVWSRELSEAADRFRRGEVADALLWLERALPADFRGLADILTAPTPRAAA